MRAWFASVLLGLVASQGSQRDTRIDELTGALRTGDVAAVHTLLARAADPNLRTGVNGWPPLLHAVHKNQLGTAHALIEGGGNLNLAGRSGTTALMMAAGYGRTRMVQLLLADGADRRLTDRRATPRSTTL